ncbi:expressed unknown protein [Seminavis robusta]|uniref:Uncharacterized protein n=1 Tax=Seminavis robusta TaxID=568900 RepID=A0A9N8E643_9STRA|nr:expressed unknown protein [Seminavis robusta]|eukprot:Sro661_g183150.1 n/a (208) ;mRNA; r:19041-19664
MCISNQAEFQVMEAVVDNRRRASASDGIKSEKSTEKHINRRASYGAAEERKARKKNLHRRVSFSDDISEPSESSYQLSKSRKRAMWYDKWEMAEIQDNLWYLIENEVDLEKEDESMRGLELYMDNERSTQSEESNQFMLQILRRVRKAGLDESFDIESLATSVNEEAIKTGDMQAAQDSAEAYMIYLETMSPETVNSFFHSPCAVPV